MNHSRVVVAVTSVHLVMSVELETNRGMSNIRATPPMADSNNLLSPATGKEIDVRLLSANLGGRQWIELSHSVG